VNKRGTLQITKEGFGAGPSVVNATDTCDQILQTISNQYKEIQNHTAISENVKSFMDAHMIRRWVRLAVMHQAYESKSTAENLGKFKYLEKLKHIAFNNNKQEFETYSKYRRFGTRVINFASAMNYTPDQLFTLVGNQPIGLTEWFRKYSSKPICDNVVLLLNEAFGDCQFKIGDKMDEEYTQTIIDEIEVINISDEEG
jgi:hypothetical protein